MAGRMGEEGLRRTWYCKMCWTSKHERQTNPHCGCPVFQLQRYEHFHLCRSLRKYDSNAYLLWIGFFSPPSDPVRKEILSKCNPCILSPCMNGAICQLEAGRKYTCDCPPGFHGKLCEYMIDACYGNPCRNGGSCKLLEEGRFR